MRKLENPAYKTREFGIWGGIKTRIYNKKAPHYPNYGGRGIKLCERWHTFANFIADMGPRPTKTHSIERIDNDGDYCPENCKWATKKEQGRNRRDNVLLTFNGETKLIVEWSELLGISEAVICSRMSKGYPIEDVLSSRRFSSRKPGVKEPTLEESIKDAIEVIRSEQKASTDLLKERLRLGAAKVSVIMAELQNRGLIGPANGSWPREIMIGAQEKSGDVDANEMFARMIKAESK